MTNFQWATKTCTSEFGSYFTVWEAAQAKEEAEEGPERAKASRDRIHDVAQREPGEDQDWQSRNCIPWHRQEGRRGLENFG